MDGDYLVIDLGSFETRLGFLNEAKPALILPTSLNDPKGNLTDASLSTSQIQNEETPHNIIYPVKKGKVTNFSAITQFWTYCFEELKITPSDYKLVLCQSNRFSIGDIRYTRQLYDILMNNLGFQEFNLVHSGQSALYASNSPTGIVIDIGFSHTNFTAYYDTFEMTHLSTSTNVGGYDLSRFLQKLLRQSLKEIISIDKCRKLKEMYSEIVLNMDKRIDVNNRDSDDFMQITILDGKKIPLGLERYICTEPLFVPAIVGKDERGLDGKLYALLEHSGIDVRPELIQNIFISGGGANLVGLKERLREEMKKIIWEQYRETIHIRCLDNPSTANWLGISKIIADHERRPEWIVKDW